MKKIFLSLILLSSFLSAQTSTLLNADFWKSNPSKAAVESEISKGNSPSEPNSRNFDPVTVAILNEAPLEVIKYLIDQPGNSIKKSTHDGRNYIHWAAFKGNEQLVDYLIKKGSDINKTDDKGATPLAFAASIGQTNPTIYKYFFDAGINPKEKYSNGETILFKAIGNDKDFKLTEYLLSKGLSLKDVDNSGNTVFDYAAINGNIDLLKALISKKVKPTNSALIFASRGSRFSDNKLETYKYLVEEVKLDPKVKGSNGENVLHNIVRRKDQKNIINYFIEKGIDVNDTDNDGNNLLMIVSGTDNIDGVKQILEKTKEINTTNAKGESALFSAVRRGSSEVVSLLIEKGAKTDLKTKDGNLGVYLVQSYGKDHLKDFQDKFEILKKAGFNFSKPQADGSTLYHVAVTKNEIDLLKTLSTLNIDVNAQNADGMTALHRAAAVAQNDSILKYLLSIGAKKELKTQFEETAYDLANENEYLKDKKISIEFLK